MGKRNGNTRLGRPFIYRGSRGVDDAEQEGISGEAPEEQEASGLLEFKAVREVEEDDEVDVSFHLPSLAGILLLVLTPLLVSSLVTLWRSRTSP